MLPGSSFLRSAAWQSAALICKEEGFTHAEDDALRILAEAMCDFMEKVGRSAQQMAELAGRSRANLADMRIAVERVEASFGISPLRSLADEIADRGEEEEAWTDLPCAVPVVRELGARPAPPLQATGEQRQRGPHIPSFLPSFPAVLLGRGPLSSDSGEPRQISDADRTAAADAASTLERLTENATIAVADHRDTRRDPQLWGEWVSLESRPEHVAEGVPLDARKRVSIDLQRGGLAKQPRTEASGATSAPPRSATEEYRTFRVTIEKAADGPGSKLGWQVRESHEGLLTIVGIADGCVKIWNMAHPELRLTLQDQIFSVNGVAGRAQGVVQEIMKSRRLDMVVRRRNCGDDLSSSGCT